MKKIISCLLFYFLVMGSTFTVQAQSVNDIDSVRHAKRLSIDYMMRGFFYAASSIEDTVAPGGFASSHNSPKPVTELKNMTFSKETLSLYIDTNSQANFADKYQGYKMVIVNSSGETIGLPASDSRLSIIAEVKMEGKWQPIEYLPSSWCGNSYHTVYIKNNQYWQFNIPVYSGKHKVQLRYKLSGKNNATWHSNEITAFINKKQLSDKQGHTANNIMDPYKD
jgi:hypothetical protein